MLKKIANFKSYLNKHFHFDYWAGTVSDGRENSSIPACMVVRSVLLMGVMGLGSLLSLDQELRTKLGVSWFGAKKALSDTTMSRSLEGMDVCALRSHLYSTYIIAKDMGKSKFELQTGRRKIGIIDGSGFANRLASCLEIIGPVSLVVDLEEMSKRGKELPAGRRLLLRAKDRLGKGFVDILLGDGLYFNAPFFNLCLNEIGTDVLVKTNEVRREVIQDAMLLFKSGEYSDDIESISGFDVERGIAYTVKKCSGFSMTGVDKKVTVAWVREENMKGEVSEFWVITTADYLTAKEMRELAYIRWDIEINGFKELNQKMHTKHLYSHDANAWLAILLILFMGFNILEEFVHHVQEKIFKLFRGIKRTRKFIIKRIRQAITYAAYDFT